MIFWYVEKFENDFPHPKIKFTWMHSLGGFFWTRFFLKKSHDAQEKGIFFLLRKKTGRNLR